MDVPYHRKMNILRLSLLNTFLLIVLSVNCVIPATHDDEHNVTRTSTTEEYNSSILAIVPLQEKTNNKSGNINDDSALDSILNKSKDKTLSADQPPDKEEGNPSIIFEKKKCITQKKPKKTGNTASDQNTEKEKHTGEEIDMTTTCVTPRDDDDIIIVKNNVTQHINCSEEGRDITVCPPKVFPHGKNVQSIEHANITIKERLNRIRYNHSSEESNTTDSNTTETAHTEPHHNNQTELLSSSTISSMKLQNVRTAKVESTDTLKLEMKNSKIIDKNDEKGMPTSVITLVTTITIAIVLVVGYLGIIGWRRYVEYRYGHRELLVNDLEFDTNDLRHFEL